jgi:hypothetical protein
VISFPWLWLNFPLASVLSDFSEKIEKTLDVEIDETSGSGLSNYQVV